VFPHQDLAAVEHSVEKLEMDFVQDVLLKINFARDKSVPSKIRSAACLSMLDALPKQALQFVLTSLCDPFTCWNFETNP